jgi:hypothetical protein
MASQITLYRIFIAAPSDVTEERNVIHQVIADWNAIHSRRFRLAFEPVSWLSHAVAEDGGRPQAVLNRQIVDSSDALVAILWTRIGAPTGEAASGTIEEIERFRAAKKPTAIFFSDVAVPPNAVDEEQLGKLRAFRAEALQSGVCPTYDSYDDFRTQFERYLNKLAEELGTRVGVPRAIRQYIEACPEFAVPADLAASRVRTSRASFYTALQCVLATMDEGDEVVSSDSISFSRASGISYWLTEGLQFLGFSHEAASRGVRFTRVFVVRRHEIEEHHAVLARLCEMHNLAGVTTMVAPAEALPAECLYEYVVFGSRIIDEAVYDLHGEQILDNFLYWGAEKVAACRERSKLVRSYAEKYPRQRQRRRAGEYGKVLEAAEALRREVIESAR